MIYKLFKSKNGLIEQIKAGLKNNAYILLLVWFCTIILTPFTVSLFINSIYHSKHVIVASVPFFILLSRAIINAADGRKIIFFISGIIIFVVLSYGRFIKFYTDNVCYNKLPDKVKFILSNAILNKYRPNTQWRESCQYLQENANNKSLIILVPSYHKKPFEYYFKRNDVEIDYYRNENNLPNNPKIYDKIYLVISHKNSFERKKQLNIFLNNNNFKQIETKKYVDIEIIIYEYNKY
jgi:hypothetical protein